MVFLQTGEGVWQHSWEGGREGEGIFLTRFYRSGNRGMHFSTEARWPETLLNSCRITSSRDPHSQKKRALIPDYSGHTVVSRPIFSRKQSSEMVGNGDFSSDFVNFSLRKA